MSEANVLERTVLALDVHGGDLGLSVSVPASVTALNSDPRLHIILVGKEAEIVSELEGLKPSVRSRLDVKAADSVLPMDAKPAAVLRRGQGSSMWNAFELVAQGQAHACVSGGSTAAMMVLGVKLIGMLPGIQRPALMAYVPSRLRTRGRRNWAGRARGGRSSLRRGPCAAELLQKIWQKRLNS